MKETLDIIRAYEQAIRQGDGGSVLASVVRAEGSTYRRPGARALFLSDHEIIGLIGGGCLEADLLLQAAKVCESGKPALVRYDNTSGDDIVWGLGLGCNGKVDVLLEPVGADKSGPLDFIARCLTQRSLGVIATVIRNRDPSQIAARWMRDAAGAVEQTTDWDPRFDPSAHAAEVAATRKPKVIAVGDSDVLIEPINPPLRLLVIGAGADAVPFVATAAGLGWRVEVFDHREAFARFDRFPDASSVTLSPIADMIHLVRPDPRTAVILMTHHFLNDRKLLRAFLESSAGYCGVLGPRNRLDRLLESLRREGFEPSPERLHRLKGPVGLNLGAETPEEIALSICAEILAFFNGCDAAPLALKKGPIHARSGS
jgi:xanthine dehydrogenase accessory factor